MPRPVVDRLRVIVIALIIIYSMDIGQASDLEPTQDSISVLEISDRYTGLQAMPEARRPKIAKVELSDADTMPPILSINNVESRVWHILYQGVVIADSKKCETPFSCDLWMQVEKGPFLVAKLVRSDQTADTLTPQSAEHYSKVLSSAGIEVVGRPEEPPALSLIDVLKGPAFYNRCAACQIVAWYVGLSRRGGSPEPCWVVVDFCVPDRKIGIGPDAVTNDHEESVEFLNVYDAETGHLKLSASVQ
jgi:hypothetical protein